MKSYEQETAVTVVALTLAGSVVDDLGALLAVAPDGKRWALATRAAVRLFDGDKETRTVQVPNGAIRYRRACARVAGPVATGTISRL